MEDGGEKDGNNVLEMDVIQDEFERCLRRCELLELLPIALEMEIDGNQSEGKSKRELLRIMQEAIDGADKSTWVDLFTTLLPKFPERMQEPLEEILKGARENKTSEANIAGTEESQAILNAQILALQTQLSQMKAPDTEVKASPGLGALTAGTRLFQRDFKIVGTVGAVNSKEALNYISLCSQIAEGKRKRYPDEEIAMAVRKAVCAGTPMRTYLDSCTEMPLSEVVSFVRNCLGEKSASELFQGLTNLVQTGEEDAQMFVLRALELREKVTRSSAVEGSVRFESGVVHDAFKHTVKTGLRSDQMRMRLEPVLSGPTMKDDELLRVLNLAMSEEAERIAKQKKTVKVHAATASVAETDTLLLKKAVNSMMKQMAEMREVLEASRKNEATARSQKTDERREEHPQKATSWKKKRCQKCTDSGTSGCYHCWKCGMNGHFSRQCQQNPLNRDALPASGDSQ